MLDLGHPYTHYTPCVPVQTDMCQDAYQLLYDCCSADRTGLPPPAPRGRLLTIIRMTQNDHAKVEGKRVDCLEASIQKLIGDPEFEILRSNCFHHKGGLFAEAAQKADAPVGYTMYSHNAHLITPNNLLW